MRVTRSKAATMTYMVSIWVGIIIAGVLLYPSDYSGIAQQLSMIYTDPVGAIPNIIVSAFTSEMAGYLVTMLGLGVVGAALTTYLFGGGFTLLFAIPLILIMSLVSLFALPTTQILNSTMPAEIKMVYSVFMGTLMLITVYAFTAGRS